MVIYEVNITVNEAIYNDYYAWLIQHIKEILQIKGFVKAEVGKVEQDIATEKVQLRISYYLESYEYLQHYLTEHSPKMRAEAQSRFGDQFSATRRIITQPVYC